MIFVRLSLKNIFFRLIHFCLLDRWTVPVGTTLTTLKALSIKTYSLWQVARWIRGVNPNTGVLLTWKIVKLAFLPGFTVYAGIESYISMPDLIGAWDKDRYSWERGIILSHRLVWGDGLSSKDHFQKKLHLEMMVIRNCLRVSTYAPHSHVVRCRSDFLFKGVYHFLPCLLSILFTLSFAQSLPES